MHTISRYFQIEERGSSIGTEVGAGITTFLAMSYILATQPLFMKAAGMDTGAVFVATALISGVITILMGLYAKLPFALSTGMGSNAVLAYSMVAVGLCTWQTGIGMTFISGAIFLFLTIFGIRDLIVKMIPKTIKIAIGAAVGIFIAQLGLKSAGLMVIADGSMGLGDFKDPVVQIALFCLILVSVLSVLKVKGALFLTILAGTVVAVITGNTSQFAGFTPPPSMAPVFLKLDLKGALNLSLFPFLFSFFMGDFFSTLGTVLGVAKKADMLDENGDLPGIEKPFLVDAIGTIIGSLFGLTVVTTFVESSAGVEEGGRTGLAAVVTGILFLLSVFLFPIVQLVPAAATGPVLVYIGMSMFTGIADLDFSELSNTIPAILTIFFTAFAGGLGNGIMIGILSFTALKLLSGKAKELHPGIYVLCIPLILNFIIS